MLRETICYFSEIEGPCIGKAKPVNRECCIVPNLDFILLNLDVLPKFDARKMTKRFTQEHVRNIRWGQDSVPVEGRITRRKDHGVVNGRERYWFEDYSPRRVICDKLVANSSHKGLEDERDCDIDGFVAADPSDLERFSACQKVQTFLSPMVRALGEFILVE